MENDELRMKRNYFLFNGLKFKKGAGTASVAAVELISFLLIHEVFSSIEYIVSLLNIKLCDGCFEAVEIYLQSAL